VKENAAAAAKVCSKLAVYWRQRLMSFDADQCIADPAGAQAKVTADEYARQQAESQKQVAEYKTRLAEYNRQNQTRQNPSSEVPPSPPNPPVQDPPE
jgi:hypothetical protein